MLVWYIEGEGGWRKAIEWRFSDDVLVWYIEGRSMKPFSVASPCFSDDVLVWYIEGVL